MSTELSSAELSSNSLSSADMSTDLSFTNLPASILSFAEHALAFFGIQNQLVEFAEGLVQLLGLIK